MSGDAFDRRVPSASHAMNLRHAAALSALLLAPLVHAVDTAERKTVLDAVRPLASRDAGQPVRIKVEHLNIDAGWAVVAGALVAPSGAAPDWRKAERCSGDLDKMLWAVLQKKKDATWQVRHLDICASEPPYWYPVQYGGQDLPCGVYAGLKSSDGEALDVECIKQHRGGRRR